MILLKLGLLLIALKACGVYADEPPDKTWNICENKLVTLDEKCPSVLICYQSKLAKDSGNWKAGNRFRVKSPNASIAHECAGNDGTKGWHAVRISKEITGMMPLDSSFGSKSLSNVSNYPEINNDKALTSDNQSAGEEFMNALRFGAFMIDFDDMPLQIAALEIRQSIGKNDTKLCKTKCAAKWESQTEPPMETEPQTETPKDLSTMKIPKKDSQTEEIPKNDSQIEEIPKNDSQTEEIPKNDSQTEKNPTKDLSTTETSTKTMLSPVTPKAQNVNHLGIKCMQIEFPVDIPSFSLNISASAFGLACEEHEKQDESSSEKYDKKKDFLDRANACAQVPSSKCNKSVELFACYRSKRESTSRRNSILTKCQEHLKESSNVEGIRVQICIHREAKEQMLVIESIIGFSFSEKIYNSTRKFSIKPGETSETSLALRIVPFPILFIEFGNERHRSFIDDKTGGKNTSSNWGDKENAIIGTVLNSIVEEQINGSWTKTLHFVPPPNENMKIYFQILKPKFTKLITRQFEKPYKDNPNIIHPSRCDQLGDDCEATRQLLKKIDEIREWCAPFNPTRRCIGPRRTPTPDELKPFTRPPWDNMSLPSTKMPSNDKRTKDPLETGDVLYTKDQAQRRYDNFVKACAKCRNSSKPEKEPRRHKRQFLIGVNKWKKFPISIRFDTESLGEEIKVAKTAIKGAITWFMENTCLNFTFDKTNEENGIRIMDNGDPDICGESNVGQIWGWQELSLNCRDMGTGAHELLHALGLSHEHERDDYYNYIKLNPHDKDNADKTENYLFPYDFGSIMHYPPEWSLHNTYKRITLNRFYQQTIGQEEKPSFKDYAIINSIYCNDTCGAQNVCQNGGYPNPNRCSECFCPDGYGGKHCEALGEDKCCTEMVDQPREMEADWQTRTINLVQKVEKGFNQCTCHWKIKPNDGKKLRIQLKRLGLPPQCSAMPCKRPYFEIKFRKDKRAQGARLCCPDAIAQMSPSQNWIEAEEPGQEMIISAHLNNMNNVTIELTYETDGAKILPSDQCPDPRGLFIPGRNPGRKITCVDDMETKEIPCSRRQEFYTCQTPDHHTTVNGRQTNKTRILLECFVSHFYC
ncbi:hypothetical protein GPALN_015622 [Globodera pallida]|nr:hypothetical protein GPALN_015622 [Globodera pallida]